MNPSALHLPRTVALWSAGKGAHDLHQPQIAQKRPNRAGLGRVHGAGAATTTPLWLRAGVRRDFFGVPSMETTVHEERRLIRFSPEELFDVVSDVDCYQEFLPWCEKSIVHQRCVSMIELVLGGECSMSELERRGERKGGIDTVSCWVQSCRILTLSMVYRSQDGKELRAELKVGFRGLSEVYTSKVTMKRPRSIEVRPLGDHETYKVHRGASPQGDAPLLSLQRALSTSAPFCSGGMLLEKYLRGFIEFHRFDARLGVLYIVFFRLR